MECQENKKPDDSDSYITIDSVHTSVSQKSSKMLRAEAEKQKHRLELKLRVINETAEIERARCELDLRAVKLAIQQAELDEADKSSRSTISIATIDSGRECEHTNTDVASGRGRSTTRSVRRCRRDTSSSSVSKGDRRSADVNTGRKRKVDSDDVRTPSCDRDVREELELNAVCDDAYRANKDSTPKRKYSSCDINSVQNCDINTDINKSVTIDTCDGDSRKQTGYKDVPLVGNVASNIDLAFQRLSYTLYEGFNLPKPELLYFDGNPLDYCKFVRNFECNIESRVLDDRLRLNYLIQYCQGDAKLCIEDCVMVEDPSEGYSEARSILYSRYGRPHLVARSYIDKLVHGPCIRASEVDKLLKLSLDMQKCKLTLSKLGFRSDIDNSDTLRQIAKRLPMHMRTRWVDVAHEITERGREPCFSDLSKFVDERTRVASSAFAADLNAERSQKPQHKSPVKVTGSSKDKITTFATSSSSDTKPVHKCYGCSGNCADLSNCGTFRGLSLEKRNQIISKYKLCRNCLKGSHFAYKCRKPNQCNVSGCNQKHNYLLHSWSGRSATGTSINCTSTVGSVRNCLGIVPVVVMGENGQTCHTYALIDDGADKSLCDERLLRELNIKTKQITFTMSTTTNTDVFHSGQEVSLKVKPVNGNTTVDLHNVWSVRSLPLSTKSAALNVDISQYPYLANIDLPNIQVGQVRLLIGTDTPDAHIPLEVRSGTSVQPYAVRTRLGWTVRGPIHSSNKVASANVHFQSSSDVILHEQLEKLWKTDLVDVCDDGKVAMSVEDRKAVRIMEDTIRLDDGHYKLGLPWRDDDVNLPDNIALAQVRLSHLKRKLQKDETLHKMYTEAVGDYIAKGYAEEVTDEDCKASGKVWYVPHHPVTNANKPGKVRVVFDCAAKYQGVSLNSMLLQGPDFMNSLVGVLIRFRQDKIAVAADIEAMYHQVRVMDTDCDALRFLWWPGGDIIQPPRCYRMKVHLFGATSSPSCAAFALRRVAEDNKDSYPEEVVSTVGKNFYVDDCLKSLPDENAAKSLSMDLCSLLQKGGFRLTKWISNSKKVIETIPESERAPSVINLGPGDNLPCNRALGVLWDVNDDKIRFRVKLESKPMTRRGILSTVCSMYDPLGLVAPVTFCAKMIVQDLCRLKLGWDTPIPDSKRIDWQNWLESLPMLENISVDRCFKGSLLCDIQNVQLHIFSDGSTHGYGACAYLRQSTVTGDVLCSLVLGKARLAPINQISIPRLELSGAVVASRLYRQIMDELEIEVDQSYFWTDSTIVLGYICNESKRFKTFVGNRVAEIRNTTNPSQWHHIDSKQNPADIASRGIDPKDVDGVKTWLHGPEFLYNDPSTWVLDYQHVPIDNDIEIKRETISLITRVEIIEDYLNYFSSWEKLKQSTAWLLRFKRFVIARHRHDRSVESGPLTVDELRQAEHAILQYIQYQSYPCEIDKLKTGAPVKTTSNLAPLNPVYFDGLLRIHGRVATRSIDQSLVILPSKHHVVDIIIRQAHDLLGHVGLNQVLSYVRNKYWIVSGTSAVKRVIGKCFTCKRYRGMPCQQQMAPLRQEQVTPGKPPFTFVGIDFFGPMMVRVGRVHEKRYGCIFTCLTTRAVHFEVTHSLNMNSFVSAFQRFTCRRGTPLKVFSDNGTNLVAGERELKHSIRDWNQSVIGKYMSQREIEWHFNPPQASHMGGAWERLIRSVRIILKSLVKEQLVNDEQLLTLIATAEQIMNDRPITKVSSDPRDPPALTPSMLLLMKSNPSLPKGIFSREENYCRKWWKQVQYMADVFWRRWIREYLPVLQARTKWKRQSRDICVGDVVLVAEDNVPRGKWMLGRVSDVNSGRDGRVRSCVVKLGNSEVTRPIMRLCFLEGSE